MGPVYFHGETMRPFMGEGDLVIVEPVDWEEIAVGDIITYRFEDKFPTRRVVRIDHAAGTSIVRGDSIRGWPDFHVRREDVLGRATVVIRDGVRIDRRSMEWRWAAFRALTVQRAARSKALARWFVRGSLSRAARVLHLR
ncbi:MAG: hypothetical protein AB7Q29_04320 [Vicinamibacterales bacterium]